MFPHVINQEILLNETEKVNWKLGNSRAVLSKLTQQLIPTMKYKWKPMHNSEKCKSLAQLILVKALQHSYHSAATQQSLSHHFNSLIYSFNSQSLIIQCESKVTWLLISNHSSVNQPSLRYQTAITQLSISNHSVNVVNQPSWVVNQPSLSCQSAIMQLSNC